jgi:hypothetical protein
MPATLRAIPQLGILHADKPNRDSMALDLIEAIIRPHCDKYVLMMLDTGTGVHYGSNGKPTYRDRRWFTETREVTHIRALRENVHARDLLPDHLWPAVRMLIPEPPAGPYGKRTGRSLDTTQDRAVIAALTAHELLGIPWGAIPVDISSQRCQARLKAWTWTQTEHGSVWERMTEVIQANGHLSTLAARWRQPNPLCGHA